MSLTELINSLIDRINQFGDLLSSIQIHIGTLDSPAGNDTLEGRIKLLEQGSSVLTIDERRLVTTGEITLAYAPRGDLYIQVFENATSSIWVGTLEKTDWTVSGTTVTVPAELENMLLTVIYTR